MLLLSEFAFPVFIGFNNKIEKTKCKQNVEMILIFRFLSIIADALE